MKRYIQQHIKDDLSKKMVFITGPRQVGKTYLAKELLKEYKSAVYLNFDDIDDSTTIRKRQWPQSADLVIFDEIHKMKAWKKYLKGTFDTRNPRQAFLVTGSARLATFKKGGDSLAGRYFHYRLNPLSVKELQGKMPAYEAVNALDELGGFPEPFLSGNVTQAQRWRSHYYSDLVREDILDFSRIHEVRAIRVLLELLRKRVGSPMSYTSLARDLQIAPNTVRKYVAILEDLYIIFLVRPFHRNIARAILKEPKVYFYDSGYVDGAQDARLENTAALCLLKHVQYLQDTTGQDIELNYTKTKDGREVDFVVVQRNSTPQFIEVKLSETEVSPALKYFKQMFPSSQAIQLVYNMRQPKEIDGIFIEPAGEWLSRLAA